MGHILVTGGAGFVGSHVAERWSARGERVTVLDDLSRSSTLPTADRAETAQMHNWRRLEKAPGVSLVRGDVRDAALVQKLARDADVIVHAAAQVAVTSSLTDPRHDFEVNAVGTFNVLEAARLSGADPAVVVASTNKVYGDNVNQIPVREAASRYSFADPAFEQGIPESLTIDHAEHTPYGTSKLTADLYAQDYARVYGLKTGVFRMSCIYGAHQFGNEDQGWLAHFILATLRKKPLSIYGDGKQVRDVLFVEDLVDAYQAFVEAPARHGVWNVGGGTRHTTSLVELLDLLEKETGLRSPTTLGPWRAGDQKVYVSDTRKIERDLGWHPRIGLHEGVRRFVSWARALN